MVRTLLRVVLVVIVVAAIVAFFAGYRLADRRHASPEYSTGTTGTATATVNVDRARDAGAAIGERVAQGANEAAA